MLEGNILDRKWGWIDAWGCGAGAGAGDWGVWSLYVCMYVFMYQNLERR